MPCPRQPGVKILLFFLITRELRRVLKCQVQLLHQIVLPGAGPLFGPRFAEYLPAHIEQLMGVIWLRLVVGGWTPVFGDISLR